MRVISAISFGTAGRRLLSDSSPITDHCQPPGPAPGQIRAVPPCCRPGIRRCGQARLCRPLDHTVTAHVIIERLAEAADIFAGSIATGGYRPLAVAKRPFRSWEGPLTWAREGIRT